MGDLQKECYCIVAVLLTGTSTGMEGQLCDTREASRECPWSGKDCRAAALPPRAGVTPPSPPPEAFLPLYLLDRRLFPRVLRPTFRSCGSGKRSASASATSFTRRFFWLRLTSGATPKGSFWSGC